MRSKLADSWLKLPDTFRYGEAASLGVDSRKLHSWCASGKLELLARGVYRKTDAPLEMDDDLLVVSTRIPDGVLCLVSALQVHGLGTQIAHRIYIALPTHAWAPVLHHPPIQVFHFSREAWAYGIQDHALGGRFVRVYSPAKTIADCFKFRHRIGMDVALEALKDWRRHPDFDVGEQLSAARICRVESILKPYLEALL